MDDPQFTSGGENACRQKHTVQLGSVFTGHRAGLKAVHPCGVTGTEKALYVCVAACQTECAHRCVCKAANQALCLKRCRGNVLGVEQLDSSVSCSNALYR